MNKLNNTKNLYYAWACDLRDQTGEGFLGITFLKLLSKIYKCKIICKSPNGTIIFLNEKIIYSNLNKVVTNINPSFINNYVMPFFGVLFLMVKAFKKKKIIYVNFLPLWNFLVFFLLPKKTILGPITGFVYKGKVFNLITFLRYYFLNYLFSISILIINSKFKKIIFSTNLLRNYVKKKIKSKTFFNFTIVNLKYILKIKSSKQNFLLIYNRNYSAKENYLKNDLIKFLVKKKIQVNIIGDKLNISGVHNYGILNKKKALKIISRSKATILSQENLYSIFALECIKNNVRIFYNSSQKLDKELNFINFNKLNFFKKKKSFLIIKKSLQKKLYLRTQMIFCNKILSKFYFFFVNKNGRD